jgi:putative ABC transport system permease protein
MSSVRTLGRFLYGLGEGVRIALASLRANLFRSGLTILGVAIGVMVVVVMAALISGIRTSVAEGVEAAGPRNLWVMRFDFSDIRLVQDGTGRPPWWDRPPITMEEARRLGELPGVERSVITLGLQDPGSPGALTLLHGSTSVTGVAGFGEAAEWVDYRQATFRNGRNFVATEVQEARNVVVISARLADDIFPEVDPVGQRLRAVNGETAVPLTVVGVFETGDVLFEGQIPHLAIVPHTTAVRRLKAGQDWLQVVIVPRDDVEQGVVEDQVTGLLRSMRGLAAGERNNFAVMRSTQLMEFFDQLTAVFFIVMLSLSSVGLLVGGVGVVGIMMISVTERTREIGIRKAVGATRGEILWQFLVEAGVLTLIGGGAGLLVGASAAWAVAALTPIPASIPLWAVVASLAMAVITGMLFGLVPAGRAARMRPVQALRFE